MSSVIEIADTDFEVEVKNESEKTVLVYFWAPWCGPCRLMSPIMQAIAGYHENLKVVKLEVDANPDSRTLCKVEGVPAFRLFKNGEQLESLEGAIKKERLTELLDKHLQ
ncbi:MAG: thioredoxin [Cyanothece sp. SIO2G6]|nr:thioredoxin [Cyanothece sp. SIO2G6]